VRILRLGDRGKEVADVQHRLFALGHELGGEGLDGFLGPHTAHAVKTFQQQRGLLVDGIVGANTWRELVEAGYRLGERLLYLRVPYSRGDDVLALQIKLNLLGFNAGPERGIFDEAVDAAVKDFQHNAGLLPDGIVGGSTLAKLDALRKAESGREGKKIPERDSGYAAARELSGHTIVVDPGHGGTDPGWVSPHDLKEKDYALRMGLRLAQLLRAEGCRVHLTRERDSTVGLYERAEAADTVSADYLLSIHAGGHQEMVSSAAACYFFRRGHYYSEHGQRLGEYVGARLAGLGLGFAGPMGRNYAVLREPLAVALIVEPIFITDPRTERLASLPQHVDQVAEAITGGLIDYLMRAPLWAAEAPA
jgi:N-acetylmuramoyl-L-alanine amidase